MYRQIVVTGDRWAGGRAIFIYGMDSIAFGRDSFGALAIRLIASRFFLARIVPWNAHDAWLYLRKNDELPVICSRRIARSESVHGVPVIGVFPSFLQTDLAEDAATETVKDLSRIICASVDENTRRRRRTLIHSRHSRNSNRSVFLAFFTV